MIVTKNILINCLILLVSYFVCTLAKHEEYMGYKVYNIKLINDSQQGNLHKLQSDVVDFWRKPCAKYNVTGKAMIPPSHADWFDKQLSNIGVEKNIFIKDVYTYLNENDHKSTNNLKNVNIRIKTDLNSKDNKSDVIEFDEIVDVEEVEDGSIDFDFNGYHRYDTILAHLYALEDAFVNSATTVKVVVFGQTEENRPLIYLKLTSGDETNKPVAVIEAAINPRDWITVPSALNVVKRLLEENNRSFIDNIVWIVVPVLNPDGYEYTHTNLRFWTKSRSLRSGLGFICPGVNLDRNFDIDWQISDSSSSPCSHIYAGINAFSEIETQMIKHIIEEYTPTLYISLQNSGKFVTYPWRYEKAASGLFRRHYIKGLDIVEALDGYTLDSGAVAIGDRESGTSVDYTRIKEVLYTYNVGIDVEDSDGVLIPEEEIQGIAERVWTAVAAAAKDLNM